MEQGEIRAFVAGVLAGCGVTLWGARRYFQARAAEQLSAQARALRGMLEIPDIAREPADLTLTYHGLHFRMAFTSPPSFALVDNFATPTESVSMILPGPDAYRTAGYRVPTPWGELSGPEYASVAHVLETVWEQLDDFPEANVPRLLLILRSTTPTEPDDVELVVDPGAGAFSIVRVGTELQALRDRAPPVRLAALDNYWNLHMVGPYWEVVHGHRLSRRERTALVWLVQTAWTELRTMKREG